MEATRVGNFSSSEIHKLMGAPKPRATYIAEKQMELRLNRPLSVESNSKPTNWGTFIEKRAFDLLGFEYALVSQKRLSHPTVPHWTGAPDCVSADTVVDIKCPFTLKAFCELVDTMNKGLADFIKEYPEYYWQLISNSILTGLKFAELVVYCPYKSELEEIKDMTRNFIGDQNKVAFIGFANDDELPYLVDGGHYKNLNKLRFPVIEIDQAELTNEVIEAGKLLIKPL